MIFFFISGILELENEILKVCEELKEMNYAQAVRFHEDAKQYGSILGLDNIREIMRRLGDVFRKLRIVHIAGTNGKGSVCCFLASALREAGYRTGQFNSPAVFDLREMYQINGQRIGKEEYASCMTEAAAACERMGKDGFSHPTVFELETAIAFLWFYRRKCDVVLLEAGMGGALDATNLIEQPLCSVFTSVGMDHMQFLGGTQAEIAQTKAGIIKENCPVVSGKQPLAAEEVLQKTAKEKNAAYYAAPEIKEYRYKDGKLCFFYPGLGAWELAMTGSYQVQNAALAIKTLEVLGTCGYPVTVSQMKKGIKAAKWIGRFERLLDAPLFYIDGAHNAEAAEELRLSLMLHFPDKRKIGIMGVMADKPYRKMATILKESLEEIYTVTPNQERALSADELAKEWTRLGRRAVAERSVYDAVKDACNAAADGCKDAVIIAFGSLYYLKEVKDALYEIAGY